MSHNHGISFQPCIPERFSGNGYFRENITSFADERKSTVEYVPKGIISSKPVMASTF